MSEKIIKEKNLVPLMNLISSDIYREIAEEIVNEMEKNENIRFNRGYGKSIIESIIWMFVDMILQERDEAVGRE